MKRKEASHKYFSVIVSHKPLSKYLPGYGGRDGRLIKDF
jgi:hypothetical protein